MDFLEKDLEDIIFDSPNEELRKRGLNIWGKKKRQLNIGNYGRADIITYDKEMDSSYCADLIDDKEFYYEEKTYNLIDEGF
jgi:hypothetical protein